MKLAEQQINHITERIKMVILPDDQDVEEVLWGDGQGYRAIVTYWQERLQDDSRDCLEGAITDRFENLVSTLLDKQAESIAQTIYDELIEVSDFETAESVVDEAIERWENDHDADYRGDRYKAIADVYDSIESSLDEQRARQLDRMDNSGDLQEFGNYAVAEHANNG